MMVPGFIDNHVHFLDGGYYLANINLREVKSKADFIARYSDIILILQRATAGSKVETGIMKPGVVNFPARTGLTASVEHHPVFVSRYDGHMGLANSIALKNGGHYKKHHSSARRRNCKGPKNRVNQPVFSGMRPPTWYPESNS